MALSFEEEISKEPLEDGKGEKLEGEEEQWIGQLGEDGARERLLHDGEDDDWDARGVAEGARGDSADAEVDGGLDNIEDRHSDESTEQQVDRGKEEHGPGIKHHGGRDAWGDAGEQQAGDEDLDGQVAQPLGDGGRHQPEAGHHKASACERCSAADSSEAGNEDAESHLEVERAGAVGVPYPHSCFESCVREGAEGEGEREGERRGEEEIVRREGEERGR